MKKVIITLILLSIFSIGVLAAPLMNSLNYVLQAPPKSEDVRSLYNYLNTLYSRWNQIQVTTQEPNGNVSEPYGSLILYFDGSNYFLAVETKSPNGSIWNGIKLGSI